jgi:prepilin-type N-terminal cleavage/methylation domain-containing protein
MKPSKRFSRRSRRGLTLIEVVAGLALMATLLAATLTLKSRFARQRVAADQKRRATAAADALLTTWWTDPLHWPVRAAGRVPNDPDLSWQTRVVANAPVDAIGARVARLEIESASGPVLAVDLVLPRPKDRR